MDFVKFTHTNGRSSIYILRSSIIAVESYYYHPKHGDSNTIEFIRISFTGVNNKNVLYSFVKELPDEAIERIMNDGN